MTYSLLPLPYETTALAPAISERTLTIHHGKHHAAYLAKLTTLVSGSDLDGLSIPEIIVRTAKAAARKSIFNNAAQAWNHQFFWESMAKPGTTTPSAAMKKALDASFGSVDAFGAALVDAGKNHFASGWVWAIAAKNRIEIVTTANAETPISSGTPALLVCDLWEHAYYLDYQQERKTFLDAFVAKLIDWNRVEARWNAAVAGVKKSAAA